MMGSYFLGLDEILFKYRNCGIVRCSTGSLFVCKIGHKPLDYLHKLFGPSKDITKDYLKEIFGFDVPIDYMRFMACFNGAVLFDNTFAIYGLGSERGRGLCLEDQKAISLMDEWECRNWGLCPENPWRPFASISGHETLFHVEISPTDQVRISDGKKSVVLGRFSEALSRLAFILDQLSDEYGMKDKSKRAIDIEIELLITPDNCA